VKPGIHPEYKEVVIRCACGAEYPTRSTKEYSIEICAACHPFFTGREKLVDSAGRIERFNRKYGRTSEASAR
jgi:large subunit ribosomal protein L31